MHSNMNFPAAISVLGFLAACGGLVVAGLVMTIASLMKKAQLAGSAMRLTALAAMVYLGLLVSFSLASHESMLTRGEEKYFCEIDCHFAYSVADFKTSPTGDATHVLITLRTRFDETTISSQRPKDAPLAPNPREAFVVDARGREYPVTNSRGTPLTTPLKPGDAYLTELEFVAPKDANDLRLFITSPGWEGRVMIGDENSWLHKKTYFRL